MQGQGPPDAERREHTQHGQAPNEDGPTPARLVLTVPDRELMAKEIDAFIVANLIKAQPQRERLFEKLQRRLLQPGEKASARKQHPGRVLSYAALNRGPDLTELLIRQPLGFVEDEERGIRLGRARYCYCAATFGQRRYDRAGAGHLLACEVWPARDADHPVTRPSQLA